MPMALTVVDRQFSGLVSGRLEIRRFRAPDAAGLAAYRSDPAIARFQGWDTPFPLSEAQAFIESLRGCDPGEPGRWYQFAVTLKGSDPLIGDCALCRSADVPGLAELGFTFARRYQGRGYAREAVATLLRYAGHSLGMARVVAITDRGNQPARRLLEALAFEESADRDIIPPSGTLRSHELLYLCTDTAGIGS